MANPHTFKSLDPCEVCGDKVPMRYSKSGKCVKCINNLRAENTRKTMQDRIDNEGPVFRLVVDKTAEPKMCFKHMNTYTGRE